MGRWVQIILFYHGLPSMGLNSRTIPVGPSHCRRLYTWARTPSGRGVLTWPASAAALALKSPEAGVLMDRKEILTPSTWKSECPLWRPLSSLAAFLAIIITGPLLSMTMPFAYVLSFLSPWQLQELRCSSISGATESCMQIFCFW